MTKWVEEFFSEFHSRELKEIGFKKVRHTFSRDKETYIERFNFQGSSWNSSSENEPWIFYINVGVEFKDLPARIPCADFPKTHWHERIEHFLHKAGDDYSLHFPIDIQKTCARLICDLHCASDNLTDNIDEIRHLYSTRAGARFLSLKSFVKPND